jgi:hypothetical protein
MGDSAAGFAFWIAVGAGSLGLFLGPIGAALGKWIESHGKMVASIAGDDPDRAEESARVAAVEGRLAELEERLDFTERVLAQQRQAMLDDVDTPPEALPVAGTR